MTDLSELESNLETNYANTQIDNTFVGQNTFDKTILLPNSPTTPETFKLTDTYTSRVTANGEQTIVDGSSTQIEKIQGSTITSTNLIPFPYRIGTDFTMGGVSVKTNIDGSITLNGTCTESIYLQLNKTPIILKAGKYYISGNPNFGENTVLVYISGDMYLYKDGVFTVQETVGINAMVAVYAGFVCNNVTVYPMLNEGETPKPFTPYFSGLKHAHINSIKSTGRNLIPFPYSFESKVVYGGVTVTVEKDGSFTLNGTATKGGGVDLVKVVLPEGTYSLSANNPIGNNVSSAILDIYSYSLGIGVYCPDCANSKSENKTVPMSTYTVRTRVKAGMIYDNYKVFPMLNEGDTALPYEPYTENIYQLPETIELAKYDYLDIQAKELVRGSYTIKLDGSEPWYVFSNGVTVGITLSDIGAPRSAYFKGVVANGDFTTLFQFTSGTATNGLGAIQAKGSSELNSVEAVKAYLEANPIYVCYEVQTPTVEKLINIPQSYTVYDNGTEYLYDENSVYGTQTTVTQTYYIHENEYEAANKAYVNNGLAKKLDKTGGVISGNLIVEGSTTTTLPALVVKNNKSTFGLTYDVEDEAFKLGLGTIDKKYDFVFNEKEGLPVALRNDSAQFTDGNIV